MTKKSKKKNKKKPVAKKISRIKNYEPHYLALILIVFLLFEGYLFTGTNWSDWKHGMAVLDISNAVTETVYDVRSVLQPVSDVVTGVDKFYQLAATEMTKLLDLSQNGPIDQISLVAGSVSEFYEQASVELATLLDMSNTSSWPGNIAGASISH